MNGLDGNDILSGMDGDDIIDGGGGSDLIVGGLGFDTLTGGTGADAFKYNSVGEAVFLGAGVSGARERITDFNATEDLFQVEIGLLKGTFNWLGSSVGASWSADSTNSEAMFDDTTDTLTVDVNADGVEDMEIVMDNVNAADLGLQNLVFV